MFNDLEKITVSQLWALPLEGFNSYLELQKVINPRPKFLGYEAKPLGSLEFGQVSDIKHHLTNPTPEGISEIFKLVFRVSEKELLSADVVSFFYAMNWINNEALRIVENEKALAGEPDPLMEAAGADKLNRFQELPILKWLAKEFSTSPQVVETWPYNLVYSLILLDKEETRVREKYNRLKSIMNGPKK